MSSIFVYRLEIYKRPTKFSFEKDNFTVSEEQILAQNDRYIVLNDSSFTKIEKKGDGFLWGRLNKEAIHFKNCLGAQGVFYTCYSEAKKRVPSIERAIHKKAEEEYGWLFSRDLDLTVLKNPTESKGDK